MFLHRAISVEVSAQAGDRHDFAYTYTYSSTVNTKRNGTHRDVLVLAGVRVRPVCGAACVELVASAGIALHRTSSLVTAECPTFPAPQPCTTTSRLDWSATERARAFAFGVDVPIGARTSRVKFSPMRRSCAAQPRSDVIGSTDDARRAGT